MVAVLISHAAIVAFAGLLVWAAVADVRRRLIPNAIPLAICGVWPVALMVAWPGLEAMLWSLVVAVVVLTAGFGLFARGIFGGGDAKLIAATSLWAGPAMVFDFLAAMALVGGAIAVAALIWRVLNRRLVMLPFVPASTEATEETAELPYGVAIAAGGLWVALRLSGL
jgi:prepilin peptidase CpaA